MELSYTFPKKSFSYIMEKYLFGPCLKFFPEQNFLYSFLKKLALEKIVIFQEMELSSPKIKKIILFSQKKSFIYISGDGTF